MATEHVIRVFAQSHSRLVLQMLDCAHSFCIHIQCIRHVFFNICFSSSWNDNDEIRNISQRCFTRNPILPYMKSTIKNRRPNVLRLTLIVKWHEHYYKHGIECTKCFPVNSDFSLNFLTEIPTNELKHMLFLLQVNNHISTFISWIPLIFLPIQWYTDHSKIVLVRKYSGWKLLSCLQFNWE